MSGKRFSEEKFKNERSAGQNTKKNGFYFALAVCLVAVGIAAWSTYDAVNGYLDVESAASKMSVSSHQVSSHYAESRVEKPTASPAAVDNNDVSKAPPVSSQEENEGVNEVVAIPEPAATPTPEPPSSPSPIHDKDLVSEIVESIEEIPTEAKSLYEISSEMIYPVNSENILSEYSMGKPIYSKTMKDWRIHVGTDIEAENGEAVKASANGVIIKVYTDAMLGNIVVAEHGDYVFYYCGLGENFLVKEGDIVEQGQTIGNVTAVPFESADAPHIHLEVKQGEVYLNPIDVIGNRSN